MYYNFTKFHYILMKNIINFYWSHLTDGPSVRSRWIRPYTDAQKSFCIGMYCTSYSILTDMYTNTWYKEIVLITYTYQYIPILQWASNRTTYISELRYLFWYTLECSCIAPPPHGPSRHHIWASLGLRIQGSLQNYIGIRYRWVNIRYFRVDKNNALFCIYFKISLISWALLKHR